MPLLYTVVTSVLTAALVLLGLYVREQVKHEAKQPYDVALALIQANHQRSLQEFGLFARRRHEVYAKLFARYRRAVNAYSSMIGLTAGHDFSRYSRKEAEEFCRTNKAGDARTLPILAAYDNNNPRLADNLLIELERDLGIWAANRFFHAAKRYEGFTELYLSDAVRSQLDDLRTRTAAVGVHLEHPDPEDRDDLNRKKEMQAAMDTLLSVMRDELRRGELPPTT